ncbi:hypothetical protein QBC39DRAFT_410003 [Podospora conica]|nr:hypothetical protein QBC39DRAFT_410003 [Schizothecium conicum]
MRLLFLLFVAAWQFLTPCESHRYPSDHGSGTPDNDLPYYSWDDGFTIYGGTWIPHDLRVINLLWIISPGKPQRFGCRVLSDVLSSPSPTEYNETSTTWWTERDHVNRDSGRRDFACDGAGCMRNILDRGADLARIRRLEFSVNFGHYTWYNGDNEDKLVNVQNKTLDWHCKMTAERAPGRMDCRDPSHHTTYFYHRVILQPVLYCNKTVEG